MILCWLPAQPAKWLMQPQPTRGSTWHGPQVSMSSPSPHIKDEVHGSLKQAKPDPCVLGRYLHATLLRGGLHSEKSRQEGHS